MEKIRNIILLVLNFFGAGFIKKELLEKVKKMADKMDENNKAMFNASEELRKKFETLSIKEADIKKQIEEIGFSPAEVLNINMVFSDNVKSIDRIYDRMIAEHIFQKSVHKDDKESLEALKEAFNRAVEFMRESVGKDYDSFKSISKKTKYFLKEVGID